MDVNDVEKDPFYLFKGEPVHGPPAGYKRADVLRDKENRSKHAPTQAATQAKEDKKRKGKGEDKSKKTERVDEDGGDTSTVLLTGLIGLVMIYVLWRLDLVDFPLLKSMGVMQDKTLDEDVVSKGAMRAPTKNNRRR